MSSTKRQKARRKQNRLDFERNYFHGGKRLHTAPLTPAKMKGVSPLQIVELQGQFPDLGYRQGIKRMDKIENRGHGKYHAYQKGDTPKSEKRQTPDREKSKLKQARIKYRVLYKALVIDGSMSSIEFDHHFKTKFQSEYSVYTRCFNT